MSKQRSKNKTLHFSYLVLIATVFFFSCRKPGIDPIPAPPLPGTTITTVTTFAGIFVEDMNKLKSPNGIVVDGSGNVFVADETNYCIRKIAPDGTASIFAGSATGISGHRDGKGTLAIFSNISGMVLDRSGNILAVDSGTGYIRKVTPDGTVSTIAGSGVMSSGNTPETIKNGSALSASFIFPKGIDIDSKGNIYITDNGSLIRKLDLTGNVSTFAGGINQGNRDGLGTDALFNVPYGLVIDASDNLFVTDRINHSIRKIDKNGNVSTLAGTGQQGFTNGNGAGASFKFPMGITIDATGNLFVADSGNQAIRKITPAGMVTTYAGTGNSGLANGPIGSASFNAPQSVELALNGTMYIGDVNNRQIRKISADQAVSSFFGDFTPTDGAGTTVYFKHPSGMSTDSQGNLFVADGGNNMIRKISPSGNVSLFAGSVQQGNSNGVGASAAFFNPVGLSINAKNEVFVADSGNYAIRKISVSGAVTSVIMNTPHGITSPTGIFVDQNDQLFFTDCGYGWIYKRSNTGNITQLASGANLGGTSGLFWNQPYQIWVDSKGYIYLADAGNHRICKSIDNGSYFNVLAGQQSAGNFAIYGRKDGSGTAASFYNPKAIVMDKEGSLYVADASNNVIRKISNSGMVTTLAGSGAKGHVDGSALSATFNYPAGLALSPDETVLYVADQGNNLIRKITLGK